MIICFILAILCLATTSSCKKKDVLPEDKMVAVLKDLYLTESVYDVKYRDFTSDNKKMALFNSVLEKHNITQAELNSSLMWYSDNPEQFIRVNDSVISMMRQSIQSLDLEYAELKKEQNKPSGSVPSYFYLSRKQPLLRFNIDSIEIFKYPNFELSFSNLGSLSQDSLMLSLTYSYIDSTIVENQYLSANRHYSIKNRSILPFKDLKNIYGYFYANPSKIADRTILLNNIILKNSNSELD